MIRARTRHVRMFFSHLSSIVGIVLIWRGIWYVLDFFEMSYLGGSRTLTSVLGIVLGLVILYLPERSFKSLHKH